MALGGVGDLLNDLKRLEGDIVQRKEVHADAAEPVLDEARSNANRGPTGKLRSSGRVTPRAGGATVRFGRKTIPWAGPVHFGHFNREQGGFVRPNPFLYDAADDRIDEVIARYEASVARLIRQNGLS